MEGVQRCFFKNVLCKELSTNNSDLCIVKGLENDFNVKDSAGKHTRKLYLC